MAESANSHVEKRYAVVTGANKGIGFGICKLLAAEGISVVLTARDEKRGLVALEKLKECGFSDDYVLFHQLDVTDSSSIASLAQFINNKIGKLDILVNNAGVGGVRVDVDALQAAIDNAGADGFSVDVEALKGSAPPGEVPDSAKYMIQDYDSAAECININYYGVKKMIEAFSPLLQKSTSPRIVNVSSSMGQLENIPDGWTKEILSDADNLTDEKTDQVVDEFLKDFKEDSLESKGWKKFLTAYTISKAAMNAYTRIVAKKYPNFKVNSVCPGFVKTDINFNTGIMSIEEGAAGPVRVALMPEDGPSGLFFARGEVTSF